MEAVGKIKNFCENNIKKKKHDQYFPISWKKKKKKNKLIILNCNVSIRLHFKFNLIMICTKSVDSTTNC